MNLKDIAPYEITIGSKKLRLETFLKPRIESGLLAVCLIALLFVSACGANDDKDRGVAGRNLEVHAENPIVVDKAFFVDEGETRVIIPSASNRQIVVVKTTIVNRTSTVIPLLVDAEAVKLGDRRGKRYEAINPFEKSKKINGTLSEGIRVKEIAPIFWDKTELPRDFQVGGYLVFDIPKGLIIGTLFWDEVEYIPVDFVDYWKNRN